MRVGEALGVVGDMIMKEDHFFGRKNTWGTRGENWVVYRESCPCIYKMSGKIREKIRVLERLRLEKTEKKRT